MKFPAVHLVLLVLFNRTERTKIDCNCSLCKEILFGALKDKSENICGLFLLTSNINILRLECVPSHPSDLLFQQSRYNQMKGSEGKCRVLLSTKRNAFLTMGTGQIQNRSFGKLLVTILIVKQISKNPQESTFKKASVKLSILSRVPSNINPKKRRVTVNAFFSSQLAYCYLGWMFH